MEMYPYHILPFPTLLVKVETEKNLPGRSLATQSIVFAVTWLPTQRACSNTYSDSERRVQKDACRILLHYCTHKSKL